MILILYLSIIVYISYTAIMLSTDFSKNFRKMRSEKWMWKRISHFKDEN